MTIFIMMGVSGSGKTTMGTALAAKLGCPFYDGDDFHPPENVAKMANGTPLNDKDRQPWLARLHELMQAHHARGETAVFACSALKKKYRTQLKGNIDNLIFVFLQGDFDLIWQRMKARTDHYMKADMLQSQFATLEKPLPTEALFVDIAAQEDAIVEKIIQQSAASLP